VLGASIFQVVSLITKDYLKLVILAGLVAIPVAWYLLKNWLNDYAFHIEIGWWFFLVPLVLIILIAGATVSYQSLKAALANPVKSLRNE
jgi:putative ABC transport system permease protein